MKIATHISPKAALAAGHDATGWHVVEIDASTLTAAQRTALDTCTETSVTSNDGYHLTTRPDLYLRSYVQSAGGSVYLTVTEPTAAAVLAEVEHAMAALVNARRKQVAEQARREQEEAERERDRDEQRKRDETNAAAAQARKNAEIASLRQWALTQGSELLYARVAGSAAALLGWEWRALAEREWLDAHTPAGYAARNGTEHARTTPELVEIEAFKDARRVHRSVELVWLVTEHCSACNETGTLCVCECPDCGSTEHCCCPDQGHSDDCPWSAPHLEERPVLKLLLTAPTGSSRTVYHCLTGESK